MPDDRPVKLEREKLDAGEVTAHLADVAAHARDLEVRVKVTGYSEAATDSLDEITRRLVAGEIAAVQIRYTRDDAWWTDTVMRAKDGTFRLVRMRQD